MQRNTRFFAAKLARQHLSVMKRNHFVDRAMHDLDPLVPDLVCKFAQLVDALMMPASSQQLTEKAFARELVFVKTLLDFLGGEAIAISRKVPVCVWLF